MHKKMHMHEMIPKKAKMIPKNDTQKAKMIPKNDTQKAKMILKISRTIADLDGKENIEAKHLMEAIRHRTVDQKYWG